MSGEGQLVTTNGNLPATAKEITDQVQLIQEVMRDVMKEDVHFGTVPGCGDKKVLLKPGAEKLGLTFRLAVSIDSQYVEHDKGHRTYTTIVRLTSFGGRVVGEGVGVASTLETKYRYRGQQVKMTDRVVPREYWDLKKSDAKAAQKLIGGTGFTTKKNEDNVWVIAEQTGERIEHPDPADYYNTVAKMSKKRAHVDATITTLAASDIFDQDLDEESEDERTERLQRENKDKGVAQQPQQQTKPRPGQDAVQGLSEGQVEHRNTLIAELSAEAEKGLDALLTKWKDMNEADRTLIGAAFGGIKRIAENKAKGGTPS